MEMLDPDLDQDLDFIPDNPADLREAVIDQAACINLADWQFVKLLVEMDRTRAWRHGGSSSLVGWLDYYCGLGNVAARERIRIGRALAKLPRIDQAFHDGEISYSKVRAITRVARPETDELLLSLARSSSSEDLERLVRTYERTGGAAPRDEATAHRARSLEWHYEDGMLKITAALPADQGAMVVQALQRVMDGKQTECDEFWEKAYNRRSERQRDSDDVETVSAENVSAENVSAETPAATGHSSESRCNCCERNDTEAVDDEDLTAGLEFQFTSIRQRQADAIVDLAEHYLASPANDPKKRRPGKRYEVVLHIDHDDMTERQQQGKGLRFHVDPGWGVDEAAARQISCDADTSAIIEDRHGGLLDITSRSRIVPARMRRALEMRDGGCCRFPGCHHRQYLEAHHIIHWIDGGETKLDNLIQLCSAHHRLLHFGEFNIVKSKDEVTFVTRHGEIIKPALPRQFPDVSAEILTMTGRFTPPSARSPLRRRSSEEVAQMIAFREQWGKASADRFMREWSKQQGTGPARKNRATS